MDKLRPFVTIIVVAIVGAYVVDKLAGGDDGTPVRSAAGESYVNARGVIDAAKRITKDAAATRHRLTGKDSR